MTTPAFLLSPRKKFGPRTRKMGAPVLFTFRMCGQADSISSRGQEFVSLRREKSCGDQKTTKFDSVGVVHLEHIDRSPADGGLADE